MDTEMNETSLSNMDEADIAEEIETSKEQEVFQKLYDLAPPEGEAILGDLNSRLKASLQYMTTLYPGWISAFKKYRSIADPLTDDLGRIIEGRANIFVPYPWAVVETEMPRLAGRLPRVHAFPRKRIETQKVEAIQDLIHYSLDRMGFLRLQQLWLRQFEIYGFSPLYYYWRSESRKVFERQQDQATGSFNLIKTEKVIWDDFAGRVIDVFDSFLQPGVDQPEDGDWFMFREYLSAKDLKQRVEAGVFYPEIMAYVKDNKSGLVSRTNDTGRQERDSIIGNDKNQTGFASQSYGRYEVMWCLEGNRVTAMLDGKILAACGDNPNPIQEKSFINLNLMPQVNEPIGISTIEALGGLPEKLNMLSNARLDNMSMTMNKVFLANRFSNTDFENIVMTAGNVIMTDNVETSVKALDVPDISEASAREIMTTKEEMQFTTGISDFIVGVKSSARLNDTATGVSSIIREGNARFALKLATFEAYPLRKLVESIHVYNMMYMPEEKRIHVLGPKGYVVKDITLDDIMCECDFIIEPGSSMPLDQQSRRDGMTQLLDRVIQLPQVVDISKFMKEVIAAYDLPSPEEFIIQKEQLPEAEDVALATAENIALIQRQKIELVGNDQLHMMIHQRGFGAAKTPEEQQAIQEHISQHQQRMQAIMAPAMQAGKNQLFGGGGPSMTIGGQSDGNNQSAQAPASGAASGAGPSPAVAGISGVPQGGGAGAGAGNPVRTQ